MFEINEEEPVEQFLEDSELEEQPIEEPIEEYVEDIDWLALSVDAFTTSDTYFNGSIRKQIDQNIDQFMGKHGSNSKYGSASYRFRSKIFRPKTRSSVRRHEAAAVTAFFSTEDIVSCEPAYQGNQAAKIGAKIAENLVNTRLTDPAMKWFLTCMGAYQDAQVQGVVISKQTWKYQKDGMAVSEDRPESTLLPAENFRFDPNADWRDPVRTSPYLIELIPMYRGDVLDLKQTEAGGVPWLDFDEDDLVSERQHNSTEMKRNDSRQTPSDQTYVDSDYEIIWIHHNIMKIQGVDVMFYTLGETMLLSEPVLVEDIYPQGRPYAVGFCNIETHKVYPSAPVEMMRGLQQEMNDIANQRLDNVKLVINRRTIVRRNAKVDVRSLTQSIPGGVVLVEDIDRDIRHDAPPDITSSSYAEQDRLSNDFDELAGSFSGSSVASNRQMNETVGGMEIMSADANTVTEYQLKIFSESWLRPVMAQFVDLERYYETSRERLGAASHGMPAEEVIALLQSEIITKLSVGYGATDPKKQIEKLAFGLNTLAQFAPKEIQNLNSDEIKKEIFGALGFQDGKRFFNPEGQGQDPQIAEMQQMIQQLQQQLQQKQIEGQTKIQVEQVKQDGNMQREQLRNQVNLEIANINQNIEYIDQQIDAEKNDLKRGELMIQREAFEESKKQQELDYVTNERNRMSEVLMNNEYKMAPGIDEGAGPG